jgi:hypothetical protein
MPDSMKQVNLLMPKDLIRDAKRAADEAGITFSDLVRQGLQRRLAEMMAGDELEYGFRPRDPEVGALALVLAAYRYRDLDSAVRAHLIDTMLNGNPAPVLQEQSADE